MSRFGAGDLGSYMGGGGGGHETDSQSTTAGNGQTILLLLVACVVCTALLSIKVSLGSTSENNGGTRYSSSKNGGLGNNGGKYVNYDDEDDDDYDILGNSSDYNSLEDLDLDALYESLGTTETWVKVGDDDLIMKVLENKTFENSIEDDFDVDVAKIRNLNNGRAEYLININMKENVPGGGLYILGITTYDIDGTETHHEVPNTNSKMFSIVAGQKLKEIKIKTYTGKIVSIGGDNKILYINRVRTTNNDMLIIIAMSSNGIAKVELLDSNNMVKAAYEYSDNKTSFNIPNVEGTTKVRITDRNGFMTEKGI